MFEQQLAAVVVWVLVPAIVVISSVGAGFAFHTIGRTLPEDEEEDAELPGRCQKVKPGEEAGAFAAKAGGSASERGVSELVGMPGAP